MRTADYGDHAVLVWGLDVLTALAAVRSALDPRDEARSDLPPVVELVPTESSLLVVLAEADDGSSSRSRLRTARGWLESVLHDCSAAAGGTDGVHDGGADDVRADGRAGRVVEIPVRYDGADLEEVARLIGLDPTEVVAAHRGQPWRVAFTGFAPGFAYLVGGDPRLRVPRRESPRTVVPAGSVGLAAHFSGVYPRESPGGWQLIGTTDAVLWDADRDPPALLQPGDLVRFQESSAIEEGPAPAGVRDAAQDGGSERVRGYVTVQAVAPGATIQDGGRPGHAHVGVTRSGAADRLSLRTANRLVGNPPEVAAFEITLGGCTLRAETDLVVAVCGAACPIWLDGRLEPTDAVLTWRAGTQLRLGTATRGLRAYLAVRGGLAPRPVLGSAATDVLSGLGPPPLRVGTRVAVGDAATTWPQVETLARTVPSIGELDAPLHVVPGPRTPGDPALERAFALLLGTCWRVGPASDRVGVRLSASSGQDAATRSSGPSNPSNPSSPSSPPDGARTAGLTTGSGSSDGLVRGAVQWPPGGDPVVFLADHPVTGGYPVVACLTGWGSDVLAQHRPGDPVFFRASSG